ncbi:MAG: hypothetical protein LBF51_02590, partial [Zoogloeaceae bacterium]|nr:hypothetical protein [Zoogloeaceae bacterium]
MKITIRRKYQTRQFSARIRPLAYAMALSFSAGSGAALAADAFSLAQEPLTSGSGVSPNLLYIHDNSGSMYYSFMPDLDRMTQGGYDSGAPASLKKIHHAKKLKSPQVNTIYYDPAQNYPPPPAPPGTDIKDAKGNLVTDGTLGNADFNDAWYDGYDIDGRNGSGNYYEDSSLVVERRVDLGTEYKATFSYSAYYHNDPKTPYKAEYLPADGTSNMKAHYYNCGSVDLDKDDCGAPVYIDTSNAAEKQNFANWYS